MTESPSTAWTRHLVVFLIGGPLDVSNWRRLEDLFAEAIELPEDERDAFVDHRCGDDGALRDELRSLLAAHATEDGFLDQAPAVGGISDAATPETLVEGTRIGAWRIGALINTGGSGEVYFATRVDGGFDQLAALKRLYRETAPDMQRFAAERQILASLEHPGIARLLDGGIASDGRLYAVVEYVDGSSLTAYCRETKADLSARLALFLDVCEVVAYAHRNLIVHRDLKPGNILVSKDGRVKLLDFGVAKRIDRNDAVLADGTTAPFTSDYAAPEQLTGQPITTATDVYALGVILFELMTGERPWRSEGLPIARIVQAIVHGEPPSMSRVAAERHGPVPARSLRGDLDAIVATCLRKDVTHRYASVDALRRDIERHLGNEPVAARGRARSYVLGRALKRYRWPVAAAVVLVASLSAGLAATLFQAHRAEVERDAARRAATREEAIRDQLTNLFRTSIEEKTGSSITAKAMLDASAKRVLVEYRDDPQLVGKVVITLADLYGALQDVDGQTALLDAYVQSAGPNADPESLALARQKLALADVLRGQVKQAAELLPKAEAVWDSAPEKYREQRLEGLFVRGAVQRSQGDLDGAIATYRAAIAGRIAFSGPATSELAHLYNSLAITLTGANRFDDALAAYRSATDVYAKLGQADDFDALVILGNTGNLALRTGRLHEAKGLLETAIEKQRMRAGDSATVAAAMGQYGATLTALGQQAKAVDVSRQAVDLASKFVSPTSPLIVQNMNFLVEALVADGRLAEARAQYADVLALTRAKFGDTAVMTLRTRAVGARIDLVDRQTEQAYGEYAALVEPLRHAGRVGEPWVAHSLVGCGDALLAEGRAADAVAPLREAVAIRERLLSDTNWELAVARVHLAQAMHKSNQPGWRELEEKGVAALASELGEAHPEVRRARLDLAST